MDDDQPVRPANVRDTSPDVVAREKYATLRGRAKELYERASALDSFVVAVDPTDSAALLGSNDLEAIAAQLRSLKGLLASVEISVALYEVGR